MIAKRYIDPPVLVSNVHEPELTEHNFFISHVRDTLDDSTVLLPAKSRLAKLLVEFSDAVRPTLCKPSRALLLRSLEHTLVELPPEVHRERSDLVNRLAKFRADGENTSSLLGVRGE